MNADKPREQGGHRAALVVVVLAVLGLRWFVPYGPLILYPFTLLSTWVHEMGHGLTALLCGGSFVRLDIFPDASGMAYHTSLPGWRSALIAAGGLLAPPLVGAVLLASSRWLPRLPLFTLGLAMLASLPLWVRTTTGWLTVAPLSLAMLAVARPRRGGGTDLSLFVTQLLGVLLGVDTVSRIGYLFVPAAQVGGAAHTSDIAVVAQGLGGPMHLWGGLLALASVLLLVLGLLTLWAGGKRPVRAR